MEKDILESTMELLVEFQGKLMLRISDSEFRHNYLYPLLHSGINGDILESIVEAVLQDGELEKIVKDIEEKGKPEKEIKNLLTVFLKKLVNSLSKFEDGVPQDYMG